MTRQIQIRRGTTAQHADFTGAVGEITMDTTTKTLRIHDGETPGGIPLARADAVSSSAADTDATNFTTTGKATIVGWGLPDYSNGVQFRIPTTGWTAPYDCFIYVPYGKSTWTSGLGFSLMVNSLNIDGIKIQASTSGTLSLTGFISAGDVITVLIGSDYVDTDNSSTTGRPMYYKLKGIA